MRSSLHSSLPGPRLRLRPVAAALAGAFVLAACGGGSDSTDSEASSDEALPAVEATSDAGADNAAAAAPVTGAGFADLVGPDIVPAAENGINPLPDVVVDDLTNDRKVNFRNLVPQDKPVLLWMYAPH